MNTPLPISAVILAKNAERHLDQVLQSLTPFSEVILLDNGSTDQTPNIAQKYPNVAYHSHPEFDGFGNMKNRASALAKNDWIFSIDSDEVITPELLNAIARADLSQSNTLYSISRTNHYRSQPISGCGWSPDIIPRLYNRAHTQFTDRAVHESIMQPENTVNKTLTGSLKHYSFDSADDLIRKMQQYSSLFADQFAHQKRTSAPSALLHGTAAFIKSYLFKRGYQHGADGLTISLSQAAGSYYKYAKLNERNRSLKVSLIITTYNRPDALQKVLNSVLTQTQLPQEILIADDGSRQDTADTIAQFAQKSPIPVQHIWQEDNGFRAAQSRNRALATAKSEYIVIIDGDMLLEKHFIEDHIQAAQKNTLIQGSRVLLTQEKTQAILTQPEKTESIKPWHDGIGKRLSAVRCPILSRQIWNKKSQSHKSIKSCNMGFFREDALEINGFNNDFIGWGREDSEFVARLYHSGCQRRNLKFAGIAYHLWHNEAERAALPQNDALLQNTLEKKLIRCENGVNDFLEFKG
ncbi:glycosyltransferase family 2 protein [Kingella negevensis]|uniref:glycosyltransferase family 2 protein n=1 Tax=Kingella negevensis TaxID=1522312 RepID=UPI00050A088E|nr:glycosyltransferase [Kingella negevensis]MDK4688971.1 glycosyltransferase [Kingella negevensis]WII90560.1 glycosyltransferase [Kingella negevensis]